TLPESAEGPIAHFDVGTLGNRQRSSSNIGARFRGLRSDSHLLQLEAVDDGDHDADHDAEAREDQGEGFEWRHGVSISTCWIGEVGRMGNGIVGIRSGLYYAMPGRRL